MVLYAITLFVKRSVLSPGPNGCNTLCGVQGSNIAGDQLIRSSPNTEEEDIVRHDITVYESIHAPAFRDRCRYEIKSFMNRTYPMGLGYTHFVSRFVTPLGVHPFQRKRNKQNVSTL